jgi:hypothetical protein
LAWRSSSSLSLAASCFSLDFSNLLVILHLCFGIRLVGLRPQLYD